MSSHPLSRPLEGPKEGVERYKLSASYSIRHRHILRLHDVLQHLVSMPPSRTNSIQSLRAWRALARCKEVDLKALYQLGGKILERTRERDEYEGEDEAEDEESTTEIEWRQSRKAEWLKWSSQGQHDRVEKLTEYILALVAAGKPRDGLNELETYLPAHPYNSSISLNVFAGYLCLLLAQPTDHNSPSALDQSESDSDDSDIDNQPTSQDAMSTHQLEVMQADAVDYTPFLKTVAESAPSRVTQAVNHFRRASRLERKTPELSFGEGARWLHILESSSATRHLAGKRARSASASDTDDD